MPIVVSVPFHYALMATEVGFRSSDSILVQDWMPVRIEERRKRDLPLVMRAKALWAWDWAIGHATTTTEIRRDGDILLAIPESLKRRKYLPGLDHLVRGYTDQTAWNMRDHPFQHRFWRTRDATDLRLRSIEESNREEAVVGVVELAAKLRMVDGTLYVPVPELAYGVRTHRSKAGSFVWIAPVAHAEICPITQAYAADRFDQAVVYAEWLASERRLCPARTEVRVLGEIELRDAGRVRLDGMSAARRNVGKAIAGLKPYPLPDEAMDAYRPFWMAYNGDDPLNVDAAVARLNRTLSGIRCDGTSAGRFARIMAEYAGRLALFGPGREALPEEDVATLSALA